MITFRDFYDFENLFFIPNHWQKNVKTAILFFFCNIFMTEKTHILHFSISEKDFKQKARLDKGYLVTYVLLSQYLANVSE